MQSTVKFSKILAEKCGKIIDSYMSEWWSVEVRFEIWSEAVNEWVMCCVRVWVAMFMCVCDENVFKWWVTFYFILCGIPETRKIYKAKQAHLREPMIWMKSILCINEFPLIWLWLLFNFVDTNTRTQNGFAAIIMTIIAMTLLMRLIRILEKHAIYSQSNPS